MGGLIAKIRSGDWLTRERMRLWALCVLAISVIAVLYLLATANGLSDYQGRPLGSDFSNVYAAGSFVIEGHPARPYDWAWQGAREQEIFGTGTQFYGWHYPPFFLFIAGTLATMPYLLALALWQGVTLVLYLVSIGAIVLAQNPALAAPMIPVRGGVKIDSWLLLALAYPAVLVNIGHGHNGFLTAALLGGALAFLNRWSVFAGILFGLLSYKPQFGLLIPLALIAGGYWRAVIAAGATVVALIGFTTLAFGMEVWSAFFDSTYLTRVEVLEAGATGWQKIQSVFSWVRMWGGSVPLAYAVQGAVTLVAAGAIVWLWRSDAPYGLKAALLAIGAILATPYSLDYDMMVLAPAMAFLAADGMARGFLPWEKSALALLWFAPLFARAVAEQTLMPIGVWAMLLVFALVLRRARGVGAVTPQQATA